MRKAMSTYVYVKERLHPGLLQGLADAGAEAIEIFCARGHFDYSNRTHVREIANWFKDSGVPLHSMHSPMFSDYDWGRSGAPPINVADTEKKRLIEAMDEIKRALEVAEQAPFRFLVQHMGMSGESFDERKFEAGMTALEHLRAFARPLGVTLLLENIPNELSTPARLLEFLHASHLDDVGICFDVGHAHMMGGVAADFDSLKPRIRSTHVHDNNRDRDSHLWPGEGTIEWKQAMALMASAPQVPPILMEIDGDGRPNILQGMAAAFERLEAAARATAQQAGG
jgi:sugar phosphate isomerase/epimerase